MCERVKEFGVRVKELAELKYVAIENEDYMVAKQIKLEMDNIRKTVSEIGSKNSFL